VSGDRETVLRLTTHPPPIYDIWDLHGSYHVDANYLEDCTLTISSTYKRLFRLSRQLKLPSIKKKAYGSAESLHFFTQMSVACL